MKQNQDAPEVVATEEVYRFAKSAEDAPSQHTDERLALMAVCVAQQQAAGFGTYIDIRQGECPECAAPGFNTGWGVWRFTCGAELHGDSGVAEPCGVDSSSKGTE